VAVTAGFVLLAAGLITGAMTGTGSGGLLLAAWMAVAGLGTGIAMSAALVELSADKSGVGSAVLQAVAEPVRGRVEDLVAGIDEPGIGPRLDPMPLSLS
jgi:hypothetical protein